MQAGGGEDGLTPRGSVGREWSSDWENVQIEDTKVRIGERKTGKVLVRDLLNERGPKVFLASPTESYYHEDPNIQSCSAIDGSA